MSELRIRFYDFSRVSDNPNWIQALAYRLNTPISDVIFLNFEKMISNQSSVILVFGGLLSSKFTCRNSAFK